MPDSVDVVKFHPNTDDAEETIQQWLDNNPDAENLDVEQVFEKHGQVGLALFYTEPTE